MFQLALATSVILSVSGTRSADFDDLEPCMGVFSWIEPPDPYHLAVRSALLNDHAYRKCQVLAVPSFRKEWAVYLFREDDRGLEIEEDSAERIPPTIVFKRLRANLWSAIYEKIERDPIDGGKSLGAEAQSAALQRLSIDVDRFTVQVSEATADVLEVVWDGMLDRTRYAEAPVQGYDGVSYFVSHFVPGSYRCGETWSPDEGTRTAALVDLAEKMAALAQAEPVQRRAQEGALAAAAHALAERLEQLRAAERGR